MAHRICPESVVHVSGLVYQPNFAVRLDLIEPRLARKTVAYWAFEPLARVAKFAGVFSTSTIGSWKFNRKQDIRVKFCNLYLFLAVFVTGLIMVDIYTAFLDVSLVSFVTLDSAATILFESFTRLCGLLVLMYMLTYPKAMVMYFNSWKSVNVNLLPFARKLRTEGIYMLILTLTLTFCCLVLSAWHMIHRFLPITALSATFFAMKLMGYTLSLFNCLFISFSGVLFVRSLTYAFRCLHLNLAHLLKEQPKDLAFQLESVRQYYEMMYHMANLTSTVYSPMLTIILIGFSVSLCMLFFLFGLEATKKESLSTILRLTGSITYRIIPVILICVVGEQMTTESSHGLNHIYSGSLRELPNDCKFLIRLLESKMLCPAKITASKFVFVDYRLLAQIAGIIVTYSLVIIEFRKTY